MTTKVQGPGGTGGVPKDPGYDITPAQMARIQGLIAKQGKEVNTNKQVAAVDEIWKLLQPAIVARYIVPMPPDDIGARYIVPTPGPSPDDDIVAEYVAVAPGRLPPGFDPSEYTNKTGAELVATINSRERATTTDDNGVIFNDDMVMFYLVAPPPTNPEQLARYNELRQFDLDMNKTFKALLATTGNVIADGKVNTAELDGFSKLHYAFDLCSKLFYDGLREYQKDFPFAPSPEEGKGPEWKGFTGKTAAGETADAKATESVTAQKMGRQAHVGKTDKGQSAAPPLVGVMVDQKKDD